MLPEPITTGAITTGGIIILIINGVALWIREWKKGKNGKENDGDIKEIKTKTECIDRKVGDIKNTMTGLEMSMKGMQENCRLTTERFDRAINENRREILDMAKDRKRK